jgi:putative peptidoglycan lipid II flippase
VAFGNLVVFVGSSLSFMHLLGHGAIALGVTLAATFQFATLVLLLRRKVGLLGLRSVASSAARIGAASVAMVAASRGLASFGDWSAGGTPMNVAVLAAALAAGLAAYLAAARLVGSPELGEVVSAVTRRGEEGRA